MLFTTDTTTPSTSRVSVGRSNLAATQRGYSYQDAIVAYLMACRVAEQNGSLTANRRAHPGDKFDDVATFNHRGHVRRQAKHMWFAQKARIEEATVDVATIEVHLGLRKDFGRIAQRSPVEAESFVRRDRVQNHLRDCLESGNEKRSADDGEARKF
jgi:hypothetical protein